MDRYIVVYIHTLNIYHMKYTFSNFIVNGLGADFIKVAMVKIYCYRNGIDFYMNELDDWGIAS